MFYKVKSVKVLSKYVLCVTFENGKIKQYNVEQLFNKFPDFQILKENDDLFMNPKVDPGGFGVSWNDEIDLSCNELWENGT